jgi:hypothetical protein
VVARRKVVGEGMHLRLGKGEKERGEAWMEAQPHGCLCPSYLKLTLALHSELCTWLLLWG